MQIFILIKELIHNLYFHHLFLLFCYYTACICMPSLYEIIDVIMLHIVKLCTIYRPLFMTKCCHHTIFGIEELKLMLSDWLKVLCTHVQSRFHMFEDLQKESAGYLPFNFCCLKLWMCPTFPTLPLHRSIELRPCDRCFGPEWIPFPLTDLLNLNILRQFWVQHTISPISS